MFLAGLEPAAPDERALPQPMRAAEKLKCATVCSGCMGRSTGDSKVGATIKECPLSSSSTF
jgi:hypothetical protein